ncbi:MULTISPECIES: hypothetical protein [unclassified Streptomyces]|uniref:hypothetical protein n=1 Tax=unclassified Streptomyces TaxID=2593676 RepID=UPI002E2341D3
MNETGGHEDFGFEARMRELLAEDAYTISPSPAPYPAIRQRGLAERRRRVALAGAVLATLAAVPVGAYAVAGGSGGRGSDTAATKPSASVPGGTAANPGTTGGTTTGSTGGPAAGGGASGPARPATDGQLLDGITFTQAADGLAACLKAEGGTKARLGKARDYRIILAAKSTGDSNAPGDGFHVVGVKEQPAGFRVVCDIEGGVGSGISVSSSDANPANVGVVVPDANGGALYQQSYLDKGHWKLPFRWAAIGTVEPSVTKVTVSYGDAGPVAATLDHGWFVAAGMLDRQVTLAPHVKGYDGAGTLVYDSDTDSTYHRTLP